MEYILLLRSCITRPIALLKRNPCDTWINAFAKKSYHWGKQKQILNLFWMLMLQRHIVAPIWQIRIPIWHLHSKESEKIAYSMKTTKLKSQTQTTFLNMQQMSSQQAVHIIFPLPLYSSSRKTIFINTALAEKQTYVLKRPILLQHEPNNFEDILCMTTFDKYVTRSTELENICLAEYASCYSATKTTTIKKMCPFVIRFI